MVSYFPEASPKDAENILPRFHTMISKLKRTLIAIHYMTSTKCIQNYLDEFCYKVNRRYFEEKLFAYQYYCLKEETLFDNRSSEGVFVCTFCENDISQIYQL
jgi:hypothetical protein